MSDESKQLAKAMRERACKCAEDLIGTCKSLHDEATEEEQNNYDFCDELDQNVFCCDDCGWWCGIDEMAENPEGKGGQYCTDCRDDEDEHGADE